jgi:hypothetical protein
VDASYAQLLHGVSKQVAFSWLVGVSSLNGSDLGVMTVWSSRLPPRFSVVTRIRGPPGGFWVVVSCLCVSVPVPAEVT